MPPATKNISFPDVISRRIDSRRFFAQQISAKDPSAPETLAYTAAVMLETHFDARKLADLVGSDRTTVVRWSTGHSVPRSSGFRKWATETLLKHLQESSDASSSSPDDTVVTSGEDSMDVGGADDPDNGPNRPGPEANGKSKLAPSSPRMR